MRQAGLANGVTVALDRVIVTANSGDGSTCYMADPNGGQMSGVEVARCAVDDASCLANPPALGSEWNVLGTYGSDDDGRSEVLGATLTPNNAGDPPVPALLTSASTVTEQSAKSTTLLGVYVAVDMSGLPTLTVQGLSDDPRQGMVNTAWVDPNNASYGSLQALLPYCGENLTLESEVNCCPDGIGPKYFAFVASAMDTANVDHGDFFISTENYGATNFTPWPCTAADLQSQSIIIPGVTQLTALAGIFDTSGGIVSIAPTNENDYSFVIGTAGGAF
jgi:hypothetical protein